MFKHYRDKYTLIYVKHAACMLTFFMHHLAWSVGTLENDSCRSFWAVFSGIF